MNYINRINPKDPQTLAALEVEERLFAHYGLDYQSHYLDMQDPALRLRVLDVGHGQPVLFVPGGTGDALFFAALMAELTGWRMIAINRPGGGLSDGIDHRRIDLRRLAVDTLQTVIDAFELGPLPIVCNSMGGLWSFWYALENPSQVTGMVQLGCPALILDTSAPFMMRLLGVPLINRLIAPNMQPKDSATALAGLRFQGSSAEDIERMPRLGGEAVYRFFNLPTYLPTWKTLVAAVATIRGGNPRYQLGAEELRKVQCPVHFIWGDKDPFGGLDVAREVTRYLPQATLNELQTGHLPFLDKPGETGRLTQSALRKFKAQIPISLQV